MAKRIRKPPSKKGSKWGHYLKKGLELGALGAVQFVPGLDVAADAAVAGEAVEGAEAVDTAATVGESTGKTLSSRVKRYAKDQAKQYVQGKIDNATQQGENYLQQRVSNYMSPYRSQSPPPQYRGAPEPYPPGGGYRSEYPPPPLYRGEMMPPQIGAGYREPYYPPPKKPLLGPLEKKLIMYGALFLIVGIIIIVIIRVLSNEVDGYIHSSTGCHCKKHTHCGSGKKHNCNCGSHTKNSGHNSCGGS